jgi:hypothetical protein
MMMAVVGFIVKVSGSSKAMAVGAPIPGRTPTIWPKKTPIPQKRRFVQVRETAKPE